MASNSNRVWSTSELQTFLDIVADTAVRNEKVFREIAQRMGAAGFERTTEGCRTKLKKLKAQYEKIRDGNNRSGNSRKTWRWYDLLDAIYGHRPANEGSSAAVDSLDPTTDTSTLEGTDDSSSEGEMEASSSRSTPQPSSSAVEEPTPARASTINLPRRTGRRRQSPADRRMERLLAELRQAEDRHREHQRWLTEQYRLQDERMADRFFQHLDILSNVLREFCRSSQ